MMLPCRVTPEGHADIAAMLFTQFHTLLICHAFRACRYCHAAIADTPPLLSLFAEAVIAD